MIGIASLPRPAKPASGPVWPSNWLVRRRPPSLGVSYRTWASAPSRHARPRPKGALSACLASCKSGWSSSCAWQPSAPWRRPIGRLESYLPRFNARFAVPPDDPTLAYLPSSQPDDWEMVFCFKYLRTVAADNTISFGGQCLQLLPGRDRRSYAHAEVEVQEHLDGHLVVRYGTQQLATTPAPADAPTLRARAGRRPPPTPTPAESASSAPGAGAPTAAASSARYSWKQPFLPKKPTPAASQKQLP